MFTTKIELEISVTRQLIEQQKDATYYCIDLDKSTDATDSLQVLHFVRSIIEENNWYEKLFALSTLKKRTLVIDAFKNFKEKLCEKDQNITNIVSVCTDGAASLTKKNVKFPAYLKKELNQTTLISFYCILYQLNLCAKSASLDDILHVNIIRVNAMRYP